MKMHWESIHSTKAPSQLGWYQPHSSRSLEFITRTNVGKSSQIIDVGGGASNLVDDLLAEGYAHLTVLDISSGALQIAQHRLGGLATKVDWIEADITQVVLPNQAYDVWHDRAVFHFLTQPDDRQKYLLALRCSLRSGGHVILSTFGLDGPSKCSGIEVLRYSTESLINEFGVGFELLHSAKETHRTPLGSEQQFLYCHFRRVQ
jgi:ubiquinone/menaquinone biosynthesis C-methylase UbiE